MTTAELLSQLNALRALNDLAPLKVWKQSRAKLEEAIAKLDFNGVPTAPAHEDTLKALDEIAESMKKVDDNVAAIEAEHGKGSATHAAKNTKSVDDKIREAKVHVKEPTVIALVDIARELGMDPKVARAKMRRLYRSSGDTKYAEHSYPAKDKQSIIDVLRGDLRKK